MSPLHLKLMRELVRLWPQVLAIALVIAAGVATLIIGIGTYDSLDRTRTQYYESNAFADVFADVTRAPASLLPEIAAIDGVARAEARITKVALVDIDGMPEPASAMLVSLPDLVPSTVNKVYLRAGRLPQPDSTDEVLISEPFALAHHFLPGARFRVSMNGTQRTVRVVGVALSPEFIYALGPGDLMPDPRRFGIIWMSRHTLAPAFNLNGAFSNLALMLLPGANERQVISRLDTLLAPYGGRGAYGRKDQMSHAFLDGELTQLRGVSEILPPIFLLVAAFLVNMTLSRMIALEREQIGLLKAIGYSSRGIALHYVEFAALIGILGAVIGIGAGIYFGAEITQLYARYYSFPYLIFSRSPAVYAGSAGITIAAAMTGAVRAALGAARLPPAVAMSPPAPARYRGALSHWIGWFGASSQSLLMIARHLLHRPWRTLGGVFGVAMSVAVLTGSLWTFGATDFLIDYAFHRTARQDASISFTGPRPVGALFVVSHLPGVRQAEPFRSVAATIGNGQIERRTSITGRPHDARLTRVQDASGVVVGVPSTGLVISSALANILHVRQGESVRVSLLEGDRRAMRVPVAAVIESYIGLATFMDLDALNRLLGESAIVSGVNVTIDPAAEPSLFSVLKSIPSASFVTLAKVSLARFRETLAQNVWVMITIYVSFAGIIAFGVIYNFARISLSEQGRELASLRVLGFAPAEVAALLLGEIGLVVLLAQPLGWIIGLGIALLAANSFSTEVYRIPLVVTPGVYATSSLVSIGAAVLSGLIVRRRINRLDLIAVLKTRE
jgi:putative ABC transport system permease protein